MAVQKNDNLVAFRSGIQGSVTAGEIAALADAGGVASGSTLGLEQALLANAGQPALTVLVAGPTTNGKLQGVSLGNGNVVEVYANGADFSAGTVLYREFMSLGEPIVFTGISFGAIVTASKGFYGVTETGGVNEITTAGSQGIMPLMSFGFSFKETFLYAFRGSTGNTNDRGIIFIANGPLSNVIKLTDGSGNVIDDQENIELDPWAATILDTNGNKEYILSGDSKMMACILSEGQGVKGTDFIPGRNWDCRLVLPTSGDLLGNPKAGRMSAPYDNTLIKYYRQQGDEGTITVSPGSPPAIHLTGGNLGDHNPAGYVRYQATGLITGYSGADGQGGDAVQFSDVSTLAQVVAQPLYLNDSGNGDETGITIFSPYEGTAKIYEWNDTTSSIDLAYTLNLTRTGVTVASKEDQLHPCAASLSNSASNANNTLLVGALNMGVIIADVPIGVVTQSQDNSTQTIRSQNGTTATTVISQEDETASYGWTPSTLRAEITEGSDGILYKRVINAGVETWVVA